MNAQISLAPPVWPKRPILDYTKDEDRASICLGTGPPSAPNKTVYHVSKLRLAYHSPRFRSLFDQKVSSRSFGFHELSKFLEGKPSVFGHVVQYMNTGSIIIPTAQVTDDGLVSDCSKCTLSHQ